MHNSQKYLRGIAHDAQTLAGMLISAPHLHAVVRSIVIRLRAVPNLWHIAHDALSARVVLACIMSAAPRIISLVLGMHFIGLQSIPEACYLNLPLG